VAANRRDQPAGPLDPLDASVRRDAGAPIVVLRGVIDGFGDDALAGAYDDAARGAPPAILLDFSRVEYINSTGIALVVVLLRRARGAGIRLLALGLSEHYVEIFTITRLADYLPIFPDEASALAACAVAARSEKE